MRAVRNESLGRAFADAVMDSQRCFRALMAAMAEPGTVQALHAGIEAPDGASRAAIIALLTLVDQETPVWMDGDGSRDVLGYLRFHTDCPIAATPADAAFAILGKHSGPWPLSAFNAGDERYPDRSTTVIVDCPALTGSVARRLKGPGIRDARVLAAELPRLDLWPDIAENHARYPLGIDLLLTADRDVLALPRSTQVSSLVEAG